jgi:hypothetical protein
MAITSSVGIIASVGRGGRNNAQDVRAIQERLNVLMGTSRQHLTVDGLSGPKTRGMIGDFQRNVLNFRWPDQRVDPAGKTIRALNDPDSARQWQRTSSNARLNINVPGPVPAIAQPSSRSCWATVATMMISWRRRESMSISDAIATIGEPYVSHFNNNQVLFWTDTEAFGRAAGMKAVPLQSFSLEGFADLLQRTRSPLFVSIHPHGNPQDLTHIVVVTGLVGDGTIDGTKVNYNNPDGGHRRSMSYRQFHLRYEGSERQPLTVQILHY